MQFVKVGEQYINFDLVKTVLVTKTGLDILMGEDVICVSGETAKYLQEVLDGAHVATVSDINRKLPASEK